MFKRVTYQLYSLILAMLMLVLSFNLQIDFHFCEGEIKSFSVFGEAKKCEKHTQLESEQFELSNHGCYKHKNTSCKHHKKHKKGCCNNKTYELNFDQDYSFEHDFISIQKPDLIFIPLFFNKQLKKEISNQFYYLKGKKEPPPLLKENKQVQFQQFNC